MDNHEELYITRVLRILLGKSLKIIVVVTTTRYNKKNFSAGNGSKISHKTAHRRKSFITQSKLMIFC